MLRRIAFFGAVILSAVSCGNDRVAESPSGPTNPVATIAEIRVTAPGAIAVGAPPAQLSAIAHFSDGATVNVTGEALWTSAPQGVVTISQTGLLTPVKDGDVTITATYRERAGNAAVRVSARQFDVTGRVLEAFSEIPIGGATITVAEGGDAGRTTTTAADGGFALTGLSQSSIVIRATAPDFEEDGAVLTSGSPALVRLEPGEREFRWTGTLTMKGQRVFEVFPVDVRHRGPLALRVHVDCRTGDSEWGPLDLIVSRSPTEGMRAPHGVASGLITRGVPHVDASAMLDPGTYYVYRRITDVYVNDPVAPCVYETFVRFPK